MSNAKEVHRLCEHLVKKFGMKLIKLAAEKQIATSTIAVATKGDINQTVLTLVMEQVFLKRVIDAGFTAADLEMAMNAIRLAGEAAQHLAVINEPISNTPSPSCAEFLNRVMYPCGSRVEKTL